MLSKYLTICEDEHNQDYLLMDKNGLNKGGYFNGRDILSVARKNPQINLIECSKIVNAYLKKVGVSKAEFCDINPEFVANGILHGRSHIERVTFLGTVICALENVSAKEYRDLLVAFKYHDCGRTMDGADTKHGVNGAVKLLKADKISKDNLPLLRAIGLHSRSESKALALLPANHKLSKDDILHTILYTRILKDADALDRVRFSDNELNPYFLRTDSAKTLIASAFNLFKFSKSNSSNNEKA